MEKYKAVKKTKRFGIINRVYAEDMHKNDIW